MMLEEQNRLVARAVQFQSKHENINIKRLIVNDS